MNVTDAQLEFLQMILKNEKYPQWFDGKSPTARALVRKGLLIALDETQPKHIEFKLTPQGRELIRDKS
jgi:hypothetical protein